jgi:NADH-quinone oxidoreductase subunit A
MQSFHSYECGFDPYGNVNYRYDIRFYVIALLFLLFDIEIIYLYPILYNLNIISYSYALIFLMILVIGLIYEYKYSIIDH